MIKREEYRKKKKSSSLPKQKEKKIELLKFLNFIKRLRIFDFIPNQQFL